MGRDKLTDASLPLKMEREPCPACAWQPVTIITTSPEVRSSPAVVPAGGGRLEVEQRRERLPKLILGVKDLHCIVKGLHCTVRDLYCTVKVLHRSAFKME